jgi:hypothetical protein
MTQAANSDPQGTEAEGVKMREDIKEIRSELRAISETLQQLAVQEQKITTLFEAHAAVRNEMSTLTSKVAQLQQDHDRCQIGAVVTDVAWVKWFVMGNTVANLALLLGIVAHYIKG